MFTDNKLDNNEHNNNYHKTSVMNTDNDFINKNNVNKCDLLVNNNKQTNDQNLEY